MTLPRRVVIDVSLLPRTVFGARDMMWWGTLGFMIIEGFTLAICASAHIYLRKNFATWPPEGIPQPSLVVPTIHATLMLASLALVTWLGKRALELDLARVRLGLTVSALTCALFVGLRAWELTQSLNVRWDANAYGSAQWLVVGTHATLMLIQALEVVGMAAIFWLGPVEKKHFSDASDLAVYWYFIVLSWIPLYVLCFLLPRWI